MTLNLFQLHFQLAAFIINLKDVHQNLWTLRVQHQHEKPATALSDQLFLQYFQGTPLLSERTRSPLVEGKLGKLRWMATVFCPVSIFALSLLSSFCISINCFSVRCYLTVLLACGEATHSSLGRPSAHLLTQFVWHYCPSLDAMGAWQTRVYDVQTCTLKQSNGSAFIGIKFLTALFFLSRRTIKAIWWWGKRWRVNRGVTWTSYGVSESRRDGVSGWKTSDLGRRENKRANEFCGFISERTLG